MHRPLSFRAPIALLALAAAGFASAQYAGAKPVPADLKKGWDTITEASARSFLSDLVSKEFAGRGTGQKGYLRAAQYMADKFKSFGVAGGMPDGSYFQMVPFTQWASHPSSMAIDPSGGTLKPGTDFDGAALTSDVNVDGPVAFFTGNAADIKFSRRELLWPDRVCQVARFLTAKRRRRLSNEGRGRRSSLDRSGQSADRLRLATTRSRVAQVRHASTWRIIDMSRLSAHWRWISVLDTQPAPRR